jgi:probable HAF family extracellular repeat protein
MKNRDRKAEICLIVLIVALSLVRADAAVKGTPVFSTAKVPQYRLKILPPLEIPDFTLPIVVPEDMNNKGEVVGRAFSTDHQHVAFLFTPKKGMIPIDPDGRYFSKAIKINDEGLVFAAAETSARFAVYLFKNGVFTPLTQGLPISRPEEFRLTDMNNSGVIIGHHSNGDPYRYTPDTGWRRIRNVFPNAGKSPIIPLDLNQGGFFTVITAGKAGQRSFLVDPFLRPERIGDFGTEYTSGVAVNSAGFVTGVSLDKNRRARAFVYIPGRAIQSLHPKGYPASLGAFFSLDDTIWGTAGTPNQNVAVFVHKLGEGSRILIQKKQFQALAPAAKLRSMTILNVNKRDEMIAEVYFMDPVNGEFIKHVYFSERHGLHDIQKFVDAIKPGYRVFDSHEINDRGQILVSLESGEDGYTAILTPKK